jgi:hypothetical protein
MFCVSRGAIVAGHPDVCRRVQDVVRYAGIFCFRYRALSSGFHHWRDASESP